MSSSILDSVTFVIVSFNSENTLHRTLHSLPESAEVVLVEQSSIGYAAEVAACVRPKTRTIGSGANRGFGAGCNLGAANASGDILVFLNPDAELADGSWEALAQVVAARDGGIVGPLIVNEHGDDITQARNWTTTRRRCVDLLLPRRLQPRGLALDVPESDGRYGTGGEFDYLQGACLAVSRSVFFSAGGFPERLFLYGEEEWLAERVLQCNGRRCMLNADVTIRHIGATSTDAVAGFAVEQMYRSAVLSTRLRRGRWRALGAALALWGAFGILALATPLRYALGFRKDQGLGWCSAGARGVWQGLVERPVAAPGSTATSGGWDRVG